jgi:hypothetical protein
MHTSPSYFTPESAAPSHSESFPYQVNEEYTPQMDNSPEALTSPQTSLTDGLGFTPRSLSDGTSLARITSAKSTALTESAAADLLSLRYLSSQTAQNPTPNSVHEDRESLEIHLDTPVTTFQTEYNGDPSLGSNLFGERDGIFLPGSAYQELHSTLRNHLISTARSNVPTRSGTPENQQPDVTFFERYAARLNTDGSDLRTESDPESLRSSKPPEISPSREYVLWKTWIDEVAPWVCSIMPETKDVFNNAQLDKFDNKRHFEQKIPIMARHSAHLRMSILAVCARQIEQKENSISLSESLGLYQEAIHLLLPELQTKNTAVIASCVILCVLEMMSCKDLAILLELLLVTKSFRLTERMEAPPRRLCKFARGSGDQRVCRWG